jgi:hypothetical protein
MRARPRGDGPDAISIRFFRKQSRQPRSGPLRDADGERQSRRGPRPGVDMNKDVRQRHRRFLARPFFRQYRRRQGGSTKGQTGRLRHSAAPNIGDSDSGRSDAVLLRNPKRPPPSSGGGRRTQIKTAPLKLPPGISTELDSVHVGAGMHS